MKIQTTLMAGLLVLIPTSSHAQAPTGWEGYTHYFELNLVDNTGASMDGTVGSWSWEDSRLGDGVFWRHQSDWIGFNLAETAQVQIRVERSTIGDNSIFFPSFTLFSGFNDTTGGAHFASNTEDLQWVPDGTPSQVLGYLHHVNNSTLDTVEDTMVLQAGNYTILLGGNAVAEDSADDVNYSVAFSAIPIPEPSAPLLGLTGLLFPLLRRKR